MVCSLFGTFFYLKSAQKYDPHLYILICSIRTHKHNYTHRWQMKGKDDIKCRTCCWTMGCNEVVMKGFLNRYINVTQECKRAMSINIEIMFLLSLFNFLTFLFKPMLLGVLHVFCISYNLEPPALRDEKWATEFSVCSNYAPPRFSDPCTLAAPTSAHTSEEIYQTSYSSLWRE